MATSFSRWRTNETRADEPAARRARTVGAVVLDRVDCLLCDGAICCDVPNRLAAATSPYLRQHASNPVAWHEWGPEAFAEARERDVPIFLSIGYSTCHWCHVMAHQTFAAEEAAARLAENFVSIKVDREERPDIDRVYMAYVQAVTGRGGWPLSVWLTPDLEPFFGGTYFPLRDEESRPGFLSVLQSIAEGWQRDRSLVKAEGQRIAKALAENASTPALGTALPDLTEPMGEAFEQTFTHLYENFDAESGGFGGAPKFPRPVNLHFLLRCAAIQGGESDTAREAVNMVQRTLVEMAKGGIHDRVGGGFHRYSVDDRWQVPHFEKMLYDQAQLASAYVETSAVTRDQRLAWVARECLDYVRRDLSHPDGGFYAGEDADSLPVQSPRSGAAPAVEATPVEGAFYGWDYDELRNLAGEAFAWVEPLYGLRPEGNVPPQHDPHGELKGRNILCQRQPLATVAESVGLAPETCAEALAGLLERLRDRRAKRPRPHRDEKIVTAWNGLMIEALASAAMSPVGVLAAESAGYLEAAERAARFLQSRLWTADTGRLGRSWCDGRVTAVGFAEDYASLIRGLLALYDATFKPAWLRWADALQGAMDRLFWDADGGGYFQAAEAPDVLVRMKEDYDGAEPSPNSMAARNLLRLGSLLHDDAYQRRAIQVAQAMRPIWSRMPWALPEMLAALEWALLPAPLIVVCGREDDAQVREALDLLRARAGRRRLSIVVLRGRPDESWLRERVPAWRELDIPRQGVWIQICRGQVCGAPLHSPAELKAELELLTRDEVGS